MPTVPLNTITGPSGARLPRVGFAEPRMAEAQGSVASAASSAASAAGRSAAIMGEAIDAERQRSATQMRIIGANADARGAAYMGLEGLGETMMRGGAEFQRLSELRSAREAQALLSDFRMSMSREMYGQSDPSTGQRIPGALEAPFVPSSDGETEQQGATISVSKSVRAWYDNPNGPFQKASPRVKELFRQYAAEPTEDFMRQAFRKDAENFQRWKETQNAAAESAALDNLNRMAAGGDQVVWDAAVQRDASTWALSQMESYQVDPSNRDPSKARWRGDPDRAQDMMAYFQNNFLQKANVQRIQALTASAAAEPDKARRAFFLQMASEASDWKPRGSKNPILPPEAVASAKLKVMEIDLELKKRDMQIEKQAFDAAQAEQVQVWAGKDATNLNEIKANLSPDNLRLLDIGQRQHDIALDKERYDAALQTYEAAVANPSTRARALPDLLAVEATMATPEGLAYAKQKNVQPTQALGSEHAEIIATTGTQIDPASGKLVFLSDAQVTDWLQRNAGVSYDASKYSSLMQKAAERKPDAQVRQNIFDIIGREIGADNLAESFKFEDGRFEQVKGDDKKIKPGKVMGEREAWLSNRAGTEVHKEKVEITARLVRQLAQAAYDYEKMPKVPGKRGQPPPTLEEYLTGLMRPDNNKLVRDLDEAAMREHIQQMEAATGAMRDAYYKRLWQSRYPATDAVP